MHHKVRMLEYSLKVKGNFSKKNKKETFLLDQLKFLLNTKKTNLHNNKNFVLHGGYKTGFEVTRLSL